MDIYAETILDHYRRPKGKMRLSQPSVSHAETNPACGDELTVDLVIHDGKIVDLGWDGTGCAISQAAMSMLSEEIMGKSEKDLEALAQKDIYAMLGVPIGPRRFKCALLCLHTVKNALRTKRGESKQSWTETVHITEDQ
ncbi:hypothetical protein A3D88_01355 [Candidatus Peribacteria bacterium RIFCSPHIGHO2_02_FULL_52_16]|nr:MAG: hypothetical protein A2706_03595 [Candidatus Peribacteria bacterium RIFCSPHIGHO2_01_FULL_51_35]OGJ60966.1 MAG: hypothetical protein A3D88_01355 [Candidatus Peribacteria bacterium RIFCSPHIGHO2_02_FULL_52_16]